MKKGPNIIIPIIVCTAVIFHTVLERIFDTVFVAPFLSKIAFVGSVKTQVAFFALIVIGIAWGLQKIAKRYQFAPWRIFWTMLIAAVYLYYRIDGTIWYCYPLWTGSSIKAADVLFLPPLYFVIALLTEWARAFSKKLKEKKNHKVAATQPDAIEPSKIPSGFKHDIPAEIDKESDSERHKFVTQLKDRIIATEAGDGSFCIGVIGPWGSGKTTFLNSMKTEFKENDDMIQLSFDPWINQDKGSLTEHFLTSLSSELSIHTDLLGKSMKKYARSLVKSEQTNVWSIAAQIVAPFFNWQISSVEELKGNIADALRKVKKKIVIFIDDIDRLDQEEIQEVLRLIRNVAGFPNVFYIVAFDKLQVESSLKEKFEFGYDRYLEKIFQIEFHLPPVRSKVLLGELITELKGRLDSRTAKVLENMFRERDWHDQDDSYIWIGDYLQHYRDVARFLNLFDLHYTFVNKEVFLPDFLVLMLLRLKYPAFYYYLYKNRFEFLTFRERQSQLFGDDGNFVLKCTDEKMRSKEATVLKAKLEQGIPKLGIQPNDMAPLDILFGIFDTNRQTNVLETIPRMRSGYKSHLSAVNSRYFSRYFDYSFTGQLSDVEFEDALNGNKEGFLKKITEWCGSKSVGNEVIETLERYDEFPNMDTFDKVTSALLVIGNGNFDGQEYVPDPSRFLRRFSRIANNGKKTAFASETDIGKYMKALFEEYCIAGNWCYSILIKAAEDNENAYFTSKEDLNLLIERVCESYFQTSPTADEAFRSIMLDWINAASSLGKADVRPDIAKYLLENITDSIQLFIGPCPRHWEEGNYKPKTDWIKAFFNSESELLSNVQRLEEDMGKELADFMNKVDSSSSKCAPYDFKHLSVPPIEKRSA